MHEGEDIRSDSNVGESFLRGLVAARAAAASEDALCYPRREYRMTDRFYDIAELVSGVQLPTGEVHVLRLRKGVLTVVVHPLDLLHFDGREPKYEEALAQSGSKNPGEASGEPILKLMLRDGKGNERIQTVDARPSSTVSRLG